MAEIKNVYRYSVSRDQCHETCPRQYYFQYYGSWGGWKREAPEKTRRLYLLKRLSNVPSWAGSTVHRTLYEVLVRLGRKETPTLEGMIAFAAERMREEFLRSERGDYRTNRKLLGLIEHERGLRVPQERKRQVWELVKTCLANYFESEIGARLMESEPSQWLLADDPGGDFDPQSIFAVDGMPVIAKPDLVFAEEAGGIRIIDWKTGKEDDGQPHQMACYALFVQARLEIPFEAMRLELHYLAAGTCREVRLDPQRIEQTRRRIVDRSRELLGLLDDPEQALACEQAFPPIDKSPICEFCSFFPVCWGRG